MICEAPITLLLKERYMSAVDSPVCLMTMGSCDSRGSTLLTCWILDSTSATARSGLASRRKFSVTVLTFCCEEDVRVSMPSALATACWIGTVMKPLMRSALAPG